MVFIIYEHEFIDCFCFQKLRFMNKIFNDRFIKKVGAKKDDTPTLSHAYKTIINPRYAFRGMNTNDKDNIKIFPVGAKPKPLNPDLPYAGTGWW